MRKPFLVLLILPVAAVLGLAYRGIERSFDPGSHADDAARVESARAALRSGADLEHAFELVSEALSPSVVSIATSQRVAVPRLGWPFGDDRVFGGRQGPPGNAPTRRGLGSGVVVSKDGYILTNNHVVNGADELQVHFHDRRNFPAKIVGVDPRTDVAVIKVEATDLVPAPLGDSDTVRVGQWVAAFGSPFGLERTVTSGIISAKGRANMGIVDYEDFLQTDAAINRGNSGGPLVNLKGEVIGINTAIVTPGQGSAGVSFAIPSNLARTIMDRLMNGGRVVRGWLGVLIQDLDPELAASLGIQAAHGVVVAEVTAKSPAATAGLQNGDVIVRLDGTEVTTVSAFRYRVSTLNPGSVAKLLVRRNGAELEVPVTVGELPAKEDLAARSGAVETQLGLELSELGEAERRSLGLGPDLVGALIVGVAPGSVADGSGLRPGDVLVGVGRTPVASVADAEQALRNVDLSRGVALRIRSGDQTRYVVLREGPR